MKIRSFLLPLTLIPALFVAYQFLDARREHRFYPQLDAYAVAYGLKPLRSSSSDELRFWSLEPMEGGIDASLYTERGAFHCEGKSEQDIGKTLSIVNSRLCTKSTIKLSNAELKSTLLQLKALRRKKTGCDDIADGWRLTVDGVLDNERFAFEAWNPDGCDNAGAKELSRILESIGKQGR